MEELLQLQKDKAEALVNLAREASDKGMALEEDVLFAQVSASQIEVARVQVAQQRQKQRLAIGRLCNIDLEERDQLLWSRIPNNSAHAPYIENTPGQATGKNGPVPYCHTDTELRTFHLIAKGTCMET